MTDVLDMPAVRTARDAMMWINANSLPGDTIRAHSDLPTVVDTEPSSSTYGRRVYLRLFGRKLTNENPITKPHRETACPKGLNDGIPIVELRAAQDPRTGTWYGGQIQGFTIRGGNQAHKSSSRLDVQNQNGVVVDPRPRNVPWQYQNLCAATLCMISETYFDGYSGPGGTLACAFEWTCRMAQLMHYDGAYMKACRVDNCHRAYAAEAYGAAVHTIHGVEISDCMFNNYPGYWDSPVAAGNGYTFGLRFVRNSGNQWAAASTWNFNGFLSSSVEIGGNTFTYLAPGSAIDLRNVVGGKVTGNVMPCKGPFAKLTNCQYVTVERNDGGPLMKGQT